MRSLSAALAVALLVAGCAGDTGGGEPLPARAPTTSPTASSADAEPAPRTDDRRRPIEVPDLADRILPSAVRALQDLGVPTYWTYTVGDRPCLSRPVVADQDPAAGPVSRGDPVGLVVEVGRCPLTDDLREAAAAYVAFARGGPPPPTAEVVALLVGQEVVTLLRAEALSDPGAWRGCPAAGYSGGLSCPFDFLASFGRGPVEVATAPPSHPCLAYGKLPPRGLADLRSVTVTRPGSCVDHAQARLWVDEADRVVAVDLALPTP